MLNKTFFNSLQKKFTNDISQRRQIISLANVILNSSKKTIFALHRKDLATAEKNFSEIESIITKLEKKFGYVRLNEEGSYKAGVEEFVEAKMFYLYLKGQKIESFKNLKISYDNYLGGACDFTGELIRLATNEAAAGNINEVENIKKVITEILNYLIKFDLTGYLRTKYDQARTNLRKIEQINYEIKIRK